MKMITITKMRPYDAMGYVTPFVAQAHLRHDGFGEKDWGLSLDPKMYGDLGGEFDGFDTADIWSLTVFNKGFAEATMRLLRTDNVSADGRMTYMSNDMHNHAKQAERTGLLESTRKIDENAYLDLIAARDMIYEGVVLPVDPSIAEGTRVVARKSLEKHERRSSMSHLTAAAQKFCMSREQQQIILLTYPWVWDSRFSSKRCDVKWFGPEVTFYDKEFKRRVETRLGAVDVNQTNLQHLLTNAGPEPIICLEYDAERSEILTLVPDGNSYTLGFRTLTQEELYGLGFTKPPEHERPKQGLSLEPDPLDRVRGIKLPEPP